MVERVLLADADGKLYGVPVDEAKRYGLSDDEAVDLINGGPHDGQQKRLAEKGFVTQVGPDELPNFRLLMQTEYPDL